MNFKKIGVIFLLSAVLVFSACKKQEKAPEITEKNSQKETVDCSMFSPPWGEEFWESWGKANPDKFESWYNEIIPKMSKVTEEDIKKCSHLDNFFVGFSKIESLEVFKEMKHLRKLDLRFSTEIKDLTPLKGLENLEFLSIWKTGVTDLTPIAGLPKLKAIDAKMAEITDVSMVDKMKSLESIDLLMTKVSDVSVFGNMPTLKEVLVCSAPVTDISMVYPIAEQITYLDLCNTKFSDFEALKRFKNLERLKLWGLPIKDASLFSEMENLWELDLWNTQIEDLSPIFNLKKLKRLVVIDLKIEKSQFEEIKKNNPEIEIVEKL
ncbi:MAG: leucine-rich repeat domain-containing protein [bacterium]